GFQCSFIPSASTLTCAPVSGPPRSRAKAGIGLFCSGVTVRPSVMTRSNSAAGTIARKIGSLRGGAGPRLPSAPWQPAQRFAYRGAKSVTWSAGTGRSAGVGRPGRSQPAVRRDRETTRQGDKETGRQGDKETGVVGPSSAACLTVDPVFLTAPLLVSTHYLY